MLFWLLKAQRILLKGNFVNWNGSKWVNSMEFWQTSVIKPLYSEYFVWKTDQIPIFFAIQIIISLIQHHFVTHFHLHQNAAFNFHISNHLYMFLFKNALILSMISSKKFSFKKCLCKFRTCFFFLLFECDWLVGSSKCMMRRWILSFFSTPLFFYRTGVQVQKKKNVSDWVTKKTRAVVLSNNSWVQKSAKKKIRYIVSNWYCKM